MQKPTSSHSPALDHLLRYISETSGQGISLKCIDTLQFTTYFDPVWTSCPGSRRSMIGCVVLLDESPINWKSKKQNILARSSAAG